MSVGADRLSVIGAYRTVGWVNVPAEEAPYFRVACELIDKDACEQRDHLRPVEGPTLRLPELLG